MARDNIRLSVDSKELSSGWTISGKKGPKENSVMTCERFISKLRHTSKVSLVKIEKKYYYDPHVHS